MPLYESTFIARQDISSQQAEALAEEFSTVIRDNGGNVASTEMWGVRNLAYRIKKNRKGHYVMLCLDAPDAAVKEMERTMRINENVMRYLTVRVESLPEGMSVMMQGRAAREERRRAEGRSDDGDSRDSRDSRDNRDGRDGRDNRDGRSGRDGRDEGARSADGGKDG